ncbi:short-chain dehydrogenase/reductase SDR [Scytonema sp. HK-05]|nr:short-chain dehydrogenase/reductase SDR [Scytonema sp. HK-05]
MWQSDQSPHRQPRESDRPSRDREDNALYRAGYGMHERGTHQGWVRSGSLYVKLSEYPVLATMTVAGLGVVIWLFTTSLVQSS